VNTVKDGRCSFDSVPVNVRTSITRPAAGTPLRMTVSACTAQYACHTRYKPMRSDGYMTQSDGIFIHLNNCHARNKPACSDGYRTQSEGQNRPCMGAYRLDKGLSHFRIFAQAQRVPLPPSIVHAWYPTNMSVKFPVVRARPEVYICHVSAAIRKRNEGEFRYAYTELRRDVQRHRNERLVL